jgi:hypothetical protein
MALSLTPAVRNWDLSQFVMVFMGINVETGFDEDDVLEIEPEAETFGHKVGADGEVARFRNNNRVNKATLHLMQTSVANSLLSALANLDQNQAGGAGIGPFLLKDLQGTTVLAGQFGWISKRPKRTFGREPKSRDWEITCVIDLEVDGNN